MGNILQLPTNPPARLDFQRVRQKRKKKDPERHGQMNLFGPSSGQSARIVNLPKRMSPFEEALTLDERGDQKASESYWQAISDGDCVADAYCNLGILESRVGRTEKAFDCFTKSLCASPRHLESHYNLANLYFEIGNLRLAREHYELATQIDPSFPNIYFNLGLVLALNEDYQAAIEALTTYQDLVSDEEASQVEELLTSLKYSLTVHR